MSVHIVAVPYDSGHRDRRLGLGPSAFLKRGIEKLLRDRGQQVSAEEIDVPSDLPVEIATSLRVAGHASNGAGVAHGDGKTPLVLSGNCSTALGGVFGVQDGDPYEAFGVIWFDAHGDMNTPETSTSGFLDGMSLAMLTGRCWRPAIHEIMSPHFRFVPEENVVLAGVRDLDPAEENELRNSRVKVARGGDGEGTLRDLEHAMMLMKAVEDVGRVYVHLDCDVLDPSVGRANEFACPGGLSAAQLERAMRMVRARFRVSGMGVSAYDPRLDPEGKVFRAIGGAVCALLA